MSTIPPLPPQPASTAAKIPADTFQINDKDALDAVVPRADQLIVAYLLGEGADAIIDEILCFADSPEALKRQLEEHPSFFFANKYRLLIHWTAKQEEIEPFADSFNQRQETKRRVIYAGWEAHRAATILRKAAEGGSSFAKQSLENIGQLMPSQKHEAGTQQLKWTKDKATGLCYMDKTCSRTAESIRQDRPRLEELLSRAILYATQCRNRKHKGQPLLLQPCDLEKIFPELVFPDHLLQEIIDAPQGRTAKQMTVRFYAEITGKTEASIMRDLYPRNK